MFPNSAREERLLILIISPPLQHTYNAVAPQGSSDRARFNILSKDLTSIQKWCGSWKLAIIPSKSAYLWCHGLQTVNDTFTPKCRHYRFLWDTYFDRQLHWNRHKSCASLKANTDYHSLFNRKIPLSIRVSPLSLYGYWVPRSYLKVHPIFRPSCF